MTGAQREILQIVREHPHQTAEYIYTVAKKSMPGIALGTVYRNLGKFSESMAIRRIARGDSPDLFDPTTTPHDHMICSKCGMAEDVDLPGLQEYLTKNTQKKIESFELLLYYICSECY
ncbi:MAG: transcriptional repressor [Oscillospiraceae bacterium]|nr:transcriptional repressor [Oscillospiraceae bacterium]MCL2279342.1 transcriptional repressor [Oscillospiraceae bacterium]